jgi:hypothetical protein
LGLGYGCCIRLVRLGVGDVDAVGGVSVRWIDLAFSVSHSCVDGC